MDEAGSRQWLVGVLTAVGGDGLVGRVVVGFGLVGFAAIFLLLDDEARIVDERVCDRIQLAGGL